jgi:NADH dehydrogenase FAD-containing subunit/uncharacterized membrane protein YphA (DoxX/SURF4 family)
MSALQTIPALTRAVRRSRAVADLAVQLLRALAWPKAELLIRLWLAKIFFVSGVLKLTHWQTALDLAANEYPVSFMPAVTAAYVGVSIELMGAALLALGLATRYAAVPLLVLSLVIHFAYMPFDEQLFWAALFGWYVVFGAGPISFDALLRRGLEDSALPLVSPMIRASTWVSANAGPLYLSVMRIWLAAALLLTAFRGSLPLNEEWATLAIWIPLGAAARLPPGIALAGGVLLLLGLGSRIMSIAAILALLTDAMMDARATDGVYLLMVFSIFAIYGAGSISVDRVLAVLLERHVPRRDPRDPKSLEALPRVVIVGAGFGGISCAAALRRASVSVTLIDRANHHLFQPLLYQVATAALSPSDIAAPVRRIFRDDYAVRVLYGAVTDVDTQGRVVKVAETEIPYDFLVLATGATHGYFGKDAWARHAPGLKRLEDAIEIRGRILTAFENAELCLDSDERASQLTFLIVGGGPTGVELAGAIAEMSRFGMDKDFRTFDPAQARVLLVQSGPRLLPAFPESLARIAQRALEKLGVEVLLGCRVESIDAEGVMVGGKRISAKTVLWAAGVTASAAAKWLKVTPDAAGRIVVGPDLGVPGFPGVFAIGDTASSSSWNGHAVPGLAPAAKQGGAYVARQIRARINERGALPPFKYRHRGSLATIGRKAAVIDFGFVKFWGAPAWWLWGIVHVGFLVGMRNRIATMTNWFWAYLTYGGGIRLITGGGESPRQR